MGASVGGGSAGGGRGRRKRITAQPMGEINVTPFVDVMLVLLIIFMVAAPLLTVGVPVNLPKTQANALPSEGKPPVELVIDAAGTPYLEKSPLSLAELITELRARAENGQETRIRIRADQDAQYGAVARVMAALNRNGFRKIALVTDRSTISGDGESPADGEGRGARPADG